jgi:hypothetical protein
LNLGPKDDESRNPKNTVRISRGYSARLSIYELLCDQISRLTIRTISLLGFKNQRNIED